MGGYGHSRLREFVLGRRDPRPVEVHDRSDVHVPLNRRPPVTSMAPKRPAIRRAIARLVLAAGGTAAAQDDVGARPGARLRALRRMSRDRQNRGEPACRRAGISPTRRTPRPRRVHGPAAGGSSEHPCRHAELPFLARRCARRRRLPAIHPGAVRRAVRPRERAPRLLRRARREGPTAPRWLAATGRGASAS